MHAKKLHEGFSLSRGNEVKLLRDENECFSYKEFIDDIREGKQSLKLCRVVAYHQNGVNERETRMIVESAQVMLVRARCLWPKAMSQLL